jgi:hypothetical protein
MVHLPAVVSLLLLEALLIADPRSELNTHLAPQALFIWSSPGHDRHCYKFSPLQAHWGRCCCTRLLWPAYLFTVHVGSAPSPLSMELSSHSHFFKLSRSKVAGRVLPLLPSQAGLFIYSSVRDCPFPAFMSCYVSFFCCCC